MHKSITLLVLLIIVLSACNLPTGQLSTPSAIPPTATQPPLPTETTSPTETPALSPTPLDPQQVVLAMAAEVALALKAQDMLALAGYVHPEAGLRFTPYAFVQNTDLVFPAGQIAGLAGDATIYHWGLYDGSGFDINLTFSDYYADFIYDVDFVLAPQVGVNQRIGVGNTIDNSLDFYPGAIIVEYHFPGFDPTYQGMDWRSLRLVFQEYAGEWYLVGIIHDEWTI